MKQADFLIFLNQGLVQFILSHIVSYGPSGSMRFLWHGLLQQIIDTHFPDLVAWGYSYLGYIILVTVERCWRHNHVIGVSKWLKCRYRKWAPMSHTWHELKWSSPAMSLSIDIIFAQFLVNIQFEGHSMIRFLHRVFWPWIAQRKFVTLWL